MSDAHHESLIKTPKQLIAAIVAGFLIPIIIIVLLVKYVGSAPITGAGSTAQTPEAVAMRIKPVADEGYTLVDVSAPRVLKTGTDVYTAACAACHDAGIAGAPKFGDTAGWSARLAQGESTLISHAIKGIRSMPAKGGNPDLDDVEVARAVVYMANAAGAKFKEPAAKAAPPVAAEAAPAMTEVAPAAPPPAAAPAASAPAKLAADTGKKIYEAACVACHGAGIAGAPKFGDKAAWAPRIKQGKDTLYKHSIEGFMGKAGMMPARGGSAASDDEVKAAVDYMVSAAQ